MENPIMSYSLTTTELAQLAQYEGTLKRMVPSSLPDADEGLATPQDEAQEELDSIESEIEEVQAYTDVYGYDDQSGELLESLLNRAIVLLRSLV